MVLCDMRILQEELQLELSCFQPLQLCCRADKLLFNSLCACLHRHMKTR